MWIGGGVMHQQQLFPWFVPPGLGDKAGVAGALALGLNAFNKEDSK